MGSVYKEQDQYAQILFAHESRVLYVTFEGNDHESHILKSLDEGKTWENRFATKDAVFFNAALCQNKIFAGMFRPDFMETYLYEYNDQNKNFVKNPEVSVPMAIECGVGCMKSGDNFYGVIVTTQIVERYTRVVIQQNDKIQANLIDFE